MSSVIRCPHFDWYTDVDQCSCSSRDRLLHESVEELTKEVQLAYG
jgi:hypothetical protein